MLMSRIAWTCWALIPVAALAYHFGPGQKAYAYDRAAGLQSRATSAEKGAAAAQGEAYKAHLAAIDARRAAFLSQAPEDAAKAKTATEAEARAYAAAGEAWKKASDAFGQILNVLNDTPGVPADDLARIRWAKSRAEVRSGDIGKGATELEDLLDEFETRGQGDCELARSTREELATAYYYGARLLRLAGRPAEEWRAVSGQARQQFRFLAEQSKARGDDQAAANNQRNVELVLNLEQSALIDIQGRPLPKQSPSKCEGMKPGNGKKKSNRPPKQKDGRGAGGVGDIGEGW